MDTLTIDYAINKLTQGYQAIAPGVQNISEKYVQYVVEKKIIEALVMLGITTILIIAATLFNRFAKKHRSDTLQMATVLCGFGAGMMFLGTLVFSYSAIIAYRNPEMYTIDKVLSRNK